MDNKSANKKVKTICHAFNLEDFPIFTSVPGYTDRQNARQPASTRIIPVNSGRLISKDSNVYQYERLAI